MVLSSSRVDSVTMFPSGCFYPPQMPTSKWVSEDPAARQLLNNHFGTNYEATVRFPQTDSAKYAFDTPQKFQLDTFKYSQEMRWPTHSDFPCQLTFQPAEAYPSDPYPSTSVALPQGIKMENNYSYPSTVIPQVYAAQSAECFPTAQQFPQFKVATMNGMNGVKMPSQPTISTPSNVSFPTGPGTNNVRVRTNEKYRMVYTDHQRLELEKEFLMSQFITAERKSQLSSSLQLTERQIKIWFQNRRAKGRREHKKLRRSGP